MDFFALFTAFFTAFSEFWAESSLVALIKFFLVVYSLVLLADIILLLILRDLPGDLKKAMYGGKKPLLSEAKAKARWAKILARLESGSVSQYKVAILEADSFASEILSSIGYAGPTMQEQIDQVIKAELQSKEKLLSAHQMRNRIIHESDLELTRKEAEDWLAHYREFFLEVELFSA